MLENASLHDNDTDNGLGNILNDRSDKSLKDENISATLSVDQDGSKSIFKFEVNVEKDGEKEVSVTFHAPVDNEGECSPKKVFSYKFPATSVEQGKFVVDISWQGKHNQTLRFKGVGQKITYRLSTITSTWSLTFNKTLFAFALFLYLISRMIGLSSYPIYFFSDEAVQTVLAIDFLRENFHNAEGEFFPTYFKNVDKYSLSTTVYMQILPFLIFGKSVFITRLTSVLVTLLAAIFISLILRDIYRLPYWWVGTLLLSMTPAWLLHSRTAFETTTMVSFYSAGLYFYLRYRYGTVRYLFLSIGFFALAFYSYNPAQVVVVITGLLLLISDAPYHWMNRRTALKGLVVIILCAIPYVRFQINHPTALIDHLTNLGSYWIQPIPWLEKLEKLRNEYLYGLSPGYWFISNGRDLIRHRMNNYSHLLSAMLPFALLGGFLVLKNFRSSAYRAVLIVFIAAPTGAVLVEVAVTRALVMVIPAIIMTSLGLIYLLDKLKKWISQRILSIGTFGLLGIINIAIVWSGLVRGPTWYSDYGLSGMQYGSQQVFKAVEDYNIQNPDTEIILSPTWANGTDVLARYFLDEQSSINLGSISAYINYRLPLDENMIFVMSSEEYEKTVMSGKFSEIQIENVLTYPDGRPGFYFVNLKYVEDIDKILTAEKEKRSILSEEKLEYEGQVLIVSHSMLDLGEISNVIDGNQKTVARTFEANPFVIVLSFSETIQFSGLSLNIGDTEVNIQASLDPGLLDQTEEFSFFGLKGSVSQPQVFLDFGDMKFVDVLHLEIEDLRQGEIGHVHVWEIEFFPGENQ